MNLDFGQQAQQFRDEVTAFFRRQLPDDIRDRFHRGLPITKAMQVQWQHLLHQQGWMAPNWPVEYGGTGWSLTEKYIYAQEASPAGNG